MWQRKPSGLRAGDRVRARREGWRVVGVRRFTACERLDLQGASSGEARRTLLYPFDRPERLAAVGPIKRVGAAAWLRRLAGVCREASSWDRLQTATDARFDLLPYQLEPALALLRGDALRLFLADEVGLGKTIQAGLLLRELAARGEADRVLIVTPAGLRDQWRGELHARFGLHARVVDAAALRHLSVTMPRGTNPLTPSGIHLLSVDFIKRPEVLQAVDELVWDVLIVDEAHALARGTDRAAAGQALACRARRVVLISATPHHGDAEAFRALCATGSLGGNDPLLIFRRTRSDVGGCLRRRTRVLRVRPTAAEARMHALLARYAAKVTEQAEGGRVGGDALLAMMVLRKRSLSSARSLARSLDRRLRWLDPARDPSPQLRLPLMDDPSECSPEDEEPDRALAAAGLTDAAAERTWIRAVLDAARVASNDESKLAVLTRLLRRAGEPAVIFTEFRDTLAHIARELDPVMTYAVLHGGLRRADRTAAVRAFTSGEARVLLATDAAAEGLNLQARCRWAINLELPWNPLRLEQRIGRVDRVGQARRVHAVHLVARDTSEEALLERLSSRLSAVRATLGDGPQPLPPSREDAVTPETAAYLEGTLKPSADLREVARCEVERIEALRRLGRARLFTAARLAPDATGPSPARAWLIRRRRRRTHPLLFVFGARITDGRGALVEILVVPVHAPATPDLSSAMDEARAHAAERVHLRCAAIVARRAALLERLASRERAIAGASAAPVTDALFQPGLFDRRAERAARSRTERAGRSRERLALRLAALDAARLVQPADGVELLLVRVGV